MYKKIVHRTIIGVFNKYLSDFNHDLRVQNKSRTKNNYFLKNTLTMVQICRLENIEHKSMKQVSYSGKYSLIYLQNLLWFFKVRNNGYPDFSDFSLQCL